MAMRTASVAFSPDGSMIATGGTDAEIKLWRVSDGALLGTFTGHFSDVLSLAFSPDGQKLASGSADKTLRMWRVSDQQQLWSKTAADAWVLAGAFSPDGNTVVSGASVSATGTLKSWNVADGSPISAAAGHADPVRSVAFSPDGQVIVTGGNHDDEGRLQYWHIAGLALLQTYDQETGSGIATYGVTSVAFSPDQQKVLYGRSDATTVLCRNPFWPVPTALDVLPVTGQVGEIVTLKADLRVWLSGAPILGKDIAFSVAGTVVGSGVTDLTGRAVYDFRIPEALGVGTQDIGGSFAGDSAYGGSDGSNTLTINRANTNIIVDRVTGILGDTVTLRGTLIRTTDDSPLAGRSVTFKVESINAGSAVTDASGVATLDFAIPLGLGAGDRTISASFAGDANNLETTGYGTLVTSKRPTTLIGQDKAGSIGSPVLFEASLAFRGAPMVGSTIGFTVDGVDVGLSVTDDTGHATLAYVIPEGAGAGDRAIRAEYAGDAVYAPSSAVTTLTVGPTATLCYVPDLDRTGAAGNDAVLRAYLYRETDRGAVVGRTVAFQVDGVDVGTAVTSETGRATGSYILPDGTSNGTSIVRATFAGDATYLPSSGQGKLTITVQKADTYLWIMPRLAEAGTNTYLRAYLRRTTDWEWLPGKTIAYQVDGTPVGSAVTDSGGRASLLYYVAPDFAPGDHTITGTFAGDSSYKGSTADGWMFVF
ncbi:MAG: hypothetical protein GX446_11930 [Chthonomonadales bacterium]|nr:hypothetical protein [Chthonomonadales bacterium]